MFSTWRRSATRYLPAIIAALHRKIFTCAISVWIFFSLKTVSYKIPACANSSTPQEDYYLCCDLKSSPQFYVFVGVMAFLYSLAAMVIYIKFDDLYRGNDLVPMGVSKITFLSPIKFHWRVILEYSVPSVCPISKYMCWQVIWTACKLIVISLVAIRLSFN